MNIKAIEDSLNDFLNQSRLKGLDFSEEAQAFKNSGLGNMAARKRFWKAVENKEKGK